MVQAEEAESDRSDSDLPLRSGERSGCQSRRCLVLGRKSGLVKQILSDLGLHCTEGRVSWRVLWSPRGVSFGFYKQLAAHQIVNRLPASVALTRKDNLVVNIRRMIKRHGSEHFGSLIPKTFLLPAETEALQDAMVAKPDALWIVKPATGSQGTDIRVIRSKKKFLLKDNAIVSRYIRPYLIDGLKFDLRLYIVVTSIEPLRIYWHREGLMRFATELYNSDFDHLSNRFIHLTNVAINRHHPNYDDGSENGHKRRLSRLWEHLGPDRSDRVKYEIETLIAKTILSGHNTISTALHHYVPQKRAGQLFELFGFDVLLDKTLHPWLLEVNRSPTLTGSSPLDSEVKSAMLQDLFNLVGVLSAGSRPSSALPTRKSVVVDTDNEYHRRGRWIRVYPRYEPNPRLALAQFFEERQTRTMASLLCNRIAAVPGRRYLNNEQEGNAAGLLPQRDDMKLLKDIRRKFGMHYPSIRPSRISR